MHLADLLARKEKWLDVQLYTSLWAMASGLAGWSGTWKNTVGKWVTWLCGEEVYGQTSLHKQRM